MRRNRGFTLVEVLIYVAIFAVVAGILSAVLITVIRAQSRDAASNEVAAQLDFVLTTVQRLVRESSLIDIVYEGTSTSTACSTYCSVRLRMEDPSREPTIIRSDANGIYIKAGTGNEVTLTTGKITVNSFSITKFEIAGGHAATQIDASFTFVTNNPQLAVTKTLQSAISRVTAATFDSDLIPNTDGSFDLGKISPNTRWQNAYFSGEVAVGASTAQSSAVLTLDSTTRGFLPPRMTTAQRDSIASPAAGLIVYNTTTGQFEGYSGSWDGLGGGAWTVSGSDIYRATGKVGIGMSSPNDTLDVVGSVGILGDFIITDGSTPIITLNNDEDVTSAPDIQFESNAVIAAEQTLYINIDSDNNNTTDALRILKDANTSGGTELFRIQENGRVGIGDSTPSYQLELSTDSAGKPGTNTWTITSDERLKQNIRSFTDGLDVILGINPIWYQYNGKGGFINDGNAYIGVIGQDIKKVAPYTVGTYTAKLNPDDETETELLNFQSHALIFNLINAVKELKQENDALKARIEAVEQKN